MTPIEGALTQSLVGSYFTSWILDKIRHSKLPFTQWIKPETADWIIKTIRAILAFAGSAGILYVWDPAEGVLTISGLTGPHLLEFGRIMALNYVALAISDNRMAHSRAVGEAPIVAAPPAEIRAAGAPVLAVDTAGKIEAAQTKEDSK